jgi:hypothetical protein
LSGKVILSNGIANFKKNYHDKKINCSITRLMLNREELKAKNIEFKKYMQKVRSTNGRRMNWLNYPSDVKNIYIRLQVDATGARLCMDIQPKDAGIREIIWEQMGELKKVLENTMNYDTIWIEHMHLEDGRDFSRILWELNNVSFYAENDRPIIFEFLKNRLLEFDEFYQEFKEILISLND